MPARGVVAFDAHDDHRRLRMLLDDGELDRVAFVQGDVAHAAQVDPVPAVHGATYVIHLAALLHPQFGADLRSGLRVARGLLTFGEPELPLPHDHEDAALRAVPGEMPRTSLAQAIAEIAEIFRPPP